MAGSNLDDMRAMAYILDNNLSRKAINNLGRVFPDKRISSEYILKKKLELFSGLQSRTYDCCFGGCILFVGPFKDHNACPICSEPRFDTRNQPRKQFDYLPLIPRLQSLYRSDRMIEMLRYRAELPPFDGTLRDVFDGEHFRSLAEKPVVVDGVEYPHKMGEADTDIFLGITFDGVSLWRGLGTVQARQST
ncbi:hypothetical protein M408DRAFT_118120, partial [Serendipita vermifera MAFF 305830]